MAQPKSLKTVWDEYSGWIFLFGSAFLIWSFRGFFTAVGGAAGAGAESVLGGVQASAQLKADKAKAKAANGGKVDGGKDKTEFTDEQIATFRQDAESLANYLGRGPGVGLIDIFKDQQSAFSLIKSRYSRLNLYNNKPCRWKDANKKSVVSQNAETTASIKNAITWRVLAPFYKEAAGGHDLLSDFRYYVTDAKYLPFFKWIL